MFAQFINAQISLYSSTVSTNDQYITGCMYDVCVLNKINTGRCIMQTILLLCKSSTFENKYLAFNAFLGNFIGFQVDINISFITTLLNAK